ncbi:hypothetical protein ACIBK9_47240 [Nonomuraea sp. NPDC050227]|uniref:hypothetical protein n=1 Tax=Nonomuraea sp. NPDC050227 TaxID=3364360 RepID=UPI0037B3EAA4
MADDLRHRYAEALAAKFTEPVYRSDRDGENEWVENPEPADRIDQTPYVMVSAGDGCRAFYTPSCAELAEVVAAVRDEELERLHAVLARVRAQAAEWAQLAERGDPCAERVDLAIADCGRDVLAALDASLPPPKSLKVEDVPMASGGD